MTEVETGKVGADLVGAIAKVQAAIGAIEKARPSDAGYKFRGIDDVMSAVHPLLVEHELLCIPSIEDVEYVGKNEKSYRGEIQPGPFDVVKVKMRFLFIGPDGSTLSFPYVMLAQNMGVDKAVGSAQSYATRYMWTGALSIPSWGDDLDPEAQDGRREIDQQQGYEPDAKERKRERQGKVAPAGGKLKLAELARAISEAADEITDELVLAKGNAMRPDRDEGEYKTLRTLVQGNQPLARQLLELVQTGQIMNDQAEPFGQPDSGTPEKEPAWRKLYTDLVTAAGEYKNAAEDPDYTGAMLVQEVEAANNVTIEGGTVEALAEHYPAYAKAKVKELRSRLDGGND